MKRLPKCRRFCAFSLAALLAAACQALAAQSPASAPPQPAPQTLPDAPTVPALLDGYVADSDGNSIPDARVTLIPQGTPPISVTTPADGSFTFVNLTPGPFRISVAADGFAPQQTSGVLQPGLALDLPTFKLAAASTTNVEVDAAPTQIAQAEVTMEEHQRVLGVVPNFYVVYDQNPAPLSAQQKYQLAMRSLVDPVNLALNAAVAGMEQAAGSYAWQEGAAGYAKRFAAIDGTFLTSTLIGNAFLPIVFHQDPRYYYKGTGSVPSRAAYALANSVICKGDNGHWQPNYSGILGGLAASAISNAYYPAPNRAGATLTFEDAAIGTGLSAIENLFQEFLIRKLTPHVRLSDPTGSPH